MTLLPPLSPRLARLVPRRLLRLETVPRLLIGLTLAAFIGYFLIYTYYAAALLRFPFDYDQGEGFELVDTLLFSRGEWPYRNNDAYPFYSSNYPPVFHLAIAPLVWLFGPAYWTGRLVSYLGTLITAAAIGYAVQRGVRRPWLAAVAGLAYLASNYIYHVGPLFRQHLFMVMFETLAVVLVAVVVEREEQRGRSDWRGLAAVLVLLLLAGYTKQLAYATVAAVCAFLFLRNWRRALLWGGLLAAATGLIFLALNVATGGEWFIATVTANINEFVPGQGIGLYRQWFNLHLVLNLTAVGYVLYQLYWERLSVYSIWFVAAAANGWTAGKWGAGESYFATAIAASCVLTGLAFGRLLNAAEPHRRVRLVALTAVPLLLLHQADRVFHMPTHTPALRTLAALLGKPTFSYIRPQTSCSPREPAQVVPYVDSVGPTLLGRPPSRADREAGLRIVELVGNGRSPAFSEEAAFNLWVGRDVVTNPTQLLNLYKNDQVDLTEMLQRIERQEFDTVVLRGQLYPPPVLHAIGQNYQRTHLVQMNGFVYCILRPHRLLP